jgi:hypothetical protein
MGCRALLERLPGLKPGLGGLQGTEKPMQKTEVETER